MTREWGGIHAEPDDGTDEYGYTYIIVREVIERIEVIAPSADEAMQAADESPIELWTRDIKGYEVAGRINPQERGWTPPIDLSERDQADEVIGR